MSAELGDVAAFVTQRLARPVPTDAKPDPDAATPESASSLSTASTGTASTRTATKPRPGTARRKTRVLGSLTRLEHITTRTPPSPPEPASVSRTPERSAPGKCPRERKVWLMPRTVVDTSMEQDFVFPAGTLRKQSAMLFLLRLPALVPLFFIIRPVFDGNGPVLNSIEADVLGTSGEICLFLTLLVTPVITVTRQRWVAPLRRWYGIAPDAAGGIRLRPQPRRRGPDRPPEALPGGGLLGPAARLAASARHALDHQAAERPATSAGST